jgi:hypothetical protein
MDVVVCGGWHGGKVWISLTGDLKREFSNLWP